MNVFRLGAMALTVLFFLALELPQVRGDMSPNVILFLTDDQGWTGTSVTMDDRVPASRSDFYRTPALERLAREGVRFSNGYAPHSNCSPSRASILTGKSPAQLGMTDLITRGSGPFFEGNRLNPPIPLNALPERELTIAEYIKQHRPRYRTAHFGKWHVGGRGPSAQGFDEGDGPTDNQTGNVGGQNPKHIFEVTDRAVDFMRRAVRDNKPFFLQISHYAVHRRIYARPQTIDRVKQRPPGERHNYVPLAAMTEDLDASLAAVLRALDSQGITDRTYVVFTSDNGAYLKDYSQQATSNVPLAGQKQTLHEGGIRVPFVVRGPQVAAGSNCHEPVIGYDLFPTIREWLGIQSPLPDGVEGGSIAAVLRGDRLDVQRPMPELVWHFPHYNHKVKITPKSAIRVGNHKLLYDYQYDEARLFDLDSDISETNDLSARNPELVREMRNRLQRHLAAIRARFPEVNADYDPSRDPAIATGHSFWLWLTIIPTVLMIATGCARILKTPSLKRQQRHRTTDRITTQVT